MLRLSVFWLFFRTKDAGHVIYGYSIYLRQGGVLLTRMLSYNSREMEAFTDYVKLGPFGGAFLVGIVRDVETLVGAFVICFRHLECECLALLEL